MFYRTDVNITTWNMNTRFSCDVEQWASSACGFTWRIHTPFLLRGRSTNPDWRFNAATCLECCANVTFASCSLTECNQRNIWREREPADQYICWMITNQLICSSPAFFRWSDPRRRQNRDRWHQMFHLILLLYWEKWNPHTSTTTQTLPASRPPQ